jgi:hypothetical protein
MLDWKAIFSSLGMAAVLGAVVTNGFAQAPVVEDLSWLNGCWEARAGTIVTEEQWLTPRGGILLGVSRTTRGDELLSFEYMRIFEREGLLVFAAQPLGGLETEFLAAQVPTGDSVVFENGAHDFPQRIRYQAVRADSLVARAEGMQRGQEQNLAFPYARVPCPSAGP